MIILVLIVGPVFAAVVVIVVAVIVRRLLQISINIIHFCPQLHAIRQFCTVYYVPFTYRLFLLMSKSSLYHVFLFTSKDIQ